jgi:hypothetical protein
LRGIKKEWPSAKGERDVGWDNRYTEHEIWQLRWLIAEAHTPTSASLVIGRSAGGITKLAQKLACPFGHLENPRPFQTSVSGQTFHALANVGVELQLPPSALNRIILTCAARRNLWADILALQRVP